MRSCVTSVFKYTSFVFTFILALSGLGVLITSAISFSDLMNYRYFFEEGIQSLQVLSIAIGVLTLILSAYGFWTIRREHQQHLKVFTVFLAIFFLTETITGIAAVVFSSNLGDSWKYYYLTQSMQRSSFDDFKYWERLQTDLKCCGINGLYDWRDFSPKQDVPKSCCKRESFCDGIVKENFFQNGCSKILREVINYNLTLLMVVSLVAACMNLLGMFFSVSLTSTLSTSDEKSDSSEKESEESEAQNDTE